MDISYLEEGYSDYVDKKGFYGPCSYDPIIEAIGDPVVQIDVEDYQGDTWVLVIDHNHEIDRIGYINIGWGSCSGCDALQACESWQEIIELAELIESQTRWWDSAAEALKWFEEHDWEVEYAWHNEELKTFLDAAKKYLRINK